MDDTKDTNTETLSELFTTTWKRFQAIEDSDEPVASQKYQDSVKRCIEDLICCTRMVNMLGLFSSNEEVQEVSTGNLRFFLLPAFLGELALKTTEHNRRTCINNAFVYFKDFLKRCHSYKITMKDLSHYVDVKNGESNNNNNNNDNNNKKAAKKPPHIQTREEKIAAYKENKTFISKIEVMQKRLDDQPSTIDDETTREYYLDWLHLWVNKSIENITFNNRELEMLEHMESRGGKVEPVRPDKDRPVMKPILITKEMIQNQVFGAGYRSLPTMTEDEYFEKELREGKIVMDYNPNAPADQKNADEQPDDDDDDDDDDDGGEKLQKARAWDEWKDTHRRGDGNKERNG